MIVSEIERFHKKVEKAEKILIIASQREDGDSIASELALKYIIQKSFSTEKVINIINERKCPVKFSFLWGADSIISFDDAPLINYDLGVVLDCGSDRSGRVKNLFDVCAYQVRIDHHAYGNSGNYDISISSAVAASTTEILFSLIDSDRWRVTLDRKLAELIYVGMSTDTGSFQYDLTKPSTLQIAAKCIATGFDFTKTTEMINLSRTWEMKKLLSSVLAIMERRAEGKILYSIITQQMIRENNASDDDVAEIIDELCFIHGVEATALFVEAEQNLTRVSLRSKGGINVGMAAGTIACSGGGHPRAAGCTLECGIDSAVKIVLDKLSAELSQNAFNN